MHWLDLLGFSAAFSVLAGFCMTSILYLRLFSLASNVLFVLYGLLAHLYPVFLLHLILLPLNLLKLYRIRWDASPKKSLALRAPPRRAAE